MLFRSMAGRPGGDSVSGQKVVWKEIAERLQRVDPPRQVAIAYGGTPPTASHPWKQRYDGMPVQGGTKRPLRGSEIVLTPPCFALNARPTASQGFAAGGAKTIGRESAKRAISNELRQGTF